MTPTQVGVLGWVLVGIGAAVVEYFAWSLSLNLRKSEIKNDRESGTVFLFALITLHLIGVIAAGIALIDASNMLEGG
ncbi:membrane protein [Gordonia phage Elinal]|nr:membrane protein [Gordonia phage Elinal]